MIPPMKMSGMNTAASEIVIERMVKPTSSAPSSAACIGCFALLDVADDVLEHHDRVVDDEAHGEGERHQRQVVDAEAQRVHHREGADDRHRQGEARDGRGREVPQEEEDHQHDEDEREDAASASPR